jgi:glycosyltransferase involved in cell wall biosynthesis
MKVLVIYPYSAYPLNHGGKIRGHQILEALAGSHEITLIALGNKEDAAAAKEWPLAKKFRHSIIVDPDLREDLTPEAARLRNAQPNPWIGRPSWMSRRDLPQMWNALAKLSLDEFEVIHARNLHMVPYALTPHKNQPLVCDLDDIASILALRGIRSQKLPWWSRWRAQSYLDFYQMRHYERTYLKRFNSVWVCSERDKEVLGSWIGESRVAVVPNVMDIEPLKAVREAKRSEPVVILVGNFAMEPNADGARFFCEQVWPAVIKQVPNARLWLVGREPGPALLARNGKNGINVFGSVPDVKPYLAQAAVAVAPLLVGAGTRVKILEAFASGVPVVATTVGAEGIDATEGKNILIADQPEALAKCCTNLLQDPELNRRIREAAFELVSTRYNIQTMRKRVTDCYATLPR